MLLISKGAGLRYYCSARGLEPLVACARHGLAKPFEALLERSYFDPYESALSEAMREAASHGHGAIALIARRLGGALNYKAIDDALDRGHIDTLNALCEAGALDSDADGSSDFPSRLDYLFAACCSRGLDSEAARCVIYGASLSGPHALAPALSVAEEHLESCAKAWLAQSRSVPPLALASWRGSFPALMLSLSERGSISESLRQRAPSARASRL